jgi:hypothetical protein
MQLQMQMTSEAMQLVRAVNPTPTILDRGIVSREAMPETLFPMGDDKKWRIN